MVLSDIRASPLSPDDSDKVQTLIELNDLVAGAIKCEELTVTGHSSRRGRHPHEQEWISQRIP